MDIIQFIAQFFYRIRYWLLWGGFIVTALVAYFTQFLPFSYTVNSNIYAGVTNVTNIDGSKIENISSTFDNLINIAKSKSTLEKVSLRLLATNLVYGEEWQDNMYIQAKHYRQLLQHTPKEVLALVDRSSLDKTVGNLQAYRQESAANFVYSMFSRPTEFYSFHALEQITVKRLGTSDLISFTYTSPDPGITQNTIKILEDELIKAYEILRFSATNSAIAYFEEQVRLAKTNLNKEEDNLMHYNVEHSVINYDNQSKDLAITKYNLDDREELAQRTYKSAVALRRMLEDKMDIRAKIIRDNTKLLKELEKVTELNQNILEQEIFSTDTELKDNEQLRQNRTDLRNSENRISQISDNLNEYNFTKEGVGIDNMVTEWLMACINECWEAFMFAAHYGLSNLCVFLDRNRLQIDGPTENVMSSEPLEDKLRAFNFNVLTIDGHDYDQIEKAIAAFHAESEKPTCILLDTTKGKGVSFMENAVDWHGKGPNDEEYEIAMKELTAAYAALEEEEK